VTLLHHLARALRSLRGPRGFGPAGPRILARPNDDPGGGFGLDGVNATISSPTYLLLKGLITEEEYKRLLNEERRKIGAARDP
jgi:hypothetical protein